MLNKITKLVTQLGLALKEKKITLVTAESCTGGGLAYYISSNPKCSSILERGFITYSNQAKEELLKVKPFTLQTKGAVSREVAIEMAKGALKNSTAQLAIAITGIAGPDKASKENRQSHGIVWISCVNNTKQQVRKKLFKGSRSKFLELVIIESLQELLSFIKNIN